MTNRTTFAEPTTDSAALEVQDLLDSRSPAGQLVTQDWEDLRTQVRDLHTLLDPQDIERPMDEGQVRYVDGKAALALRTPGGAWTEPMSFTVQGYKQLADRVLGTGGRKFVERQRSRGPEGNMMAEANWLTEMAQQTQPTLLRTLQLPGQPVRSIRAALSQRYAPYDNHNILDALLDYPGINTLHVVEARITESHMRIRFLLDPNLADRFDSNGNPTSKLVLNEPIPMAELWNGETGGSSTKIRAGMWRLWCTNGCTAWDNSSEWRWNHVGGDGHSDRVTDGLQSALDSARVKATGMVDDYREATTVTINDAAALIAQWGHGGTGGLTMGQVNAAQAALKDSSTVQPESAGRYSLAAVVDAVTLAAQGHRDMVSQRDMERNGHRLLTRGLRAARQAGGSIEIAAA